MSLAKAPDAPKPAPLQGAAALEDLLHRVVSLGFGLLTIVIITGAVWAQYVWQSWWSWDPKETSALVAWLIYAAYLHGRLQRGWRGARSAWLAILGFVAVLFCFAGINLLPDSMHSYGKPNIVSGQLGGWAGLPPLEATLTKACLMLYVLSAIGLLLGSLFRAQRAGTAGLIAAWVGLGCQTGALISRTITGGRLPFSSGYEFAMCFVWGIVLCYLLLERFRGFRAVGAAVMPICLLVAMYGYLWFPQKGSEALPPALQNKFWLHIHVAFAIFAYGCLAVAAGVAVMYLVAMRGQKADDVETGTEEIE
jgi:ABC-type transport system involved in cytochrome c biogenesis permease subunit